MAKKRDASFHDPNWKKEVSFAKTLICKYCNAIYENKQWKHLADLNPRHVDDLIESVCPACHLEQNHLSDGVVHLSGTFLKEHKKEIMGTINNLAALAEERDVLNRIERTEDTGSEITIYTTQNKLALEIGKKVADAFKGGDLDIKFSKEDMPVEVRWHKDI
jgi:hypothetical protein